ncbi:MAG: hypothetical protein IPL28_21810 [Chloroflexi bacterium]|nr:hypothetical protein [Chloroflexota bacterium]
MAGVAGQVHTLAFSADGSRLAAGTVWGGIWVWQTSTGQLLQQREPTTTRRRRALVFLDKAKATALPHQLSYSLNHGPSAPLPQMANGLPQPRRAYLSPRIAKRRTHHP